MPLWLEIAVAVAAVYGAALATYIQVVQRRERKPRIKATLSWGLAIPQEYTVLTAEATNPGVATVYVDPPILRLPDGRSLVYMGGWQTDAPNGKQLPHGERWYGTVPLRAITERLVALGFRGEIELRAEFKDRLGNTHVSPVFPMNVDEALKIIAREIAMP